MFWTNYSAYNPFTKGVSGLNVLKWTFLLLAGVLGALSASVALVHNNESCYLTLPVHIGQSGVVLESLQKYDGPYFEDGTNGYVQGIASAVFINAGSKCLESAFIEVCLEGDSYIFEVTMLPPGMRVLVLERDKSVFLYGSVTSCTISDRYIESVADEQLFVENLQDGSCRLKNVSCFEISELSVFHKRWSEETEMYLGGISYKTYIMNFQSGDELVIKSGHTFPGNSKIVCIT